MRTRSSFLLVLVLALLLATVVMATSGSTEGRPLSAAMTGPEEVPPGDPDGTGSARFTLNQGLGRVCFELAVEDIATATAAHIHAAPAGDPGPIVVPLTAPDENGTSSGCVEDVDPDLIKAIRQNPENYYVNVHNAEYPPGAVRGQLSR